MTRAEGDSARARKRLEGSEREGKEGPRLFWPQYQVGEAQRGRAQKLSSLVLYHQQDFEYLGKTADYRAALRARLGLQIIICKMAPPSAKHLQK